MSPKGANNLFARYKISQKGVMKLHSKSVAASANPKLEEIVRQQWFFLARDCLNPPGVFVQMRQTSKAAEGFSDAEHLQVAPLFWSYFEIIFPPNTKATHSLLYIPPDALPIEKYDSLGKGWGSK